MQCDYCGQEILGRPVHVEIQAEDLGPNSQVMAGDFSFCSTECHLAYLDEAGIPLDTQLVEEEEEGEEEDFLFSDQMPYSR